MNNIQHFLMCLDFTGDGGGSRPSHTLSDLGPYFQMIPNKDKNIGNNKGKIKGDFGR